MNMYVCLHPVACNSNHVHVGTISCLLEVQDKMNKFNLINTVYTCRETKIIKISLIFCQKFCVYKWEPLIIQGIVSKFHVFVHNNN